MNAAVQPWSVHQAIGSISAESWIHNYGYTQGYLKEELQEQYSPDGIYYENETDIQRSGIMNTMKM